MPTTPDPAPDTRQRLLVAAVLVFAEKGFDGTGIREIALKAQANSSLVQYYFGGKAGLYRAALAFLFEQRGEGLAALEAPPAKEAPDALPRARACLKRYVRSFLQELFACGENPELAPELRSAAHLFWTRELLRPGPDRVDMILNHVRPYVDYVTACISALRPDLDEESLFRMGAAIHGQIMFFHRDLPLISLVRGAAYGSGDIDSLTDHITAFSLRGLEVPEAIQGA